jgi:hypothetical protein
LGFLLHDVQVLCNLTVDNPEDADGKAGFAAIGLYRDHHAH